MEITERQLMLLKKAIDCLENVSGYSTINFETEGYDEVEFDPAMLVEDLRIEFNIDDK